MNRPPQSPSGSISCPHCGKAFELTEALKGQLRDHLIEEVETEARATLDREKKRIEQEASEKARTAYQVELTDTKAALEESKKAAADAQRQELKLRKQTREMQKQREQLELDVARKLDTEREQVRTEALETFAEQHRLKDQEKDKRITDLHKALEDAKRRAEQGSSETQGEVLELDLEKTLRGSFPMDDVEPVPKGIRGADLVHHVKGSDGQACGIILWETKNTKAWSEGWTTKLKDDAVMIRATVSVLVSSSLPANLKNFGYRDGIWVTDYSSMIGLATALRMHLQELSFEKRASAGKGEKMEALYDYLSGPEFRQKVVAIVETFTGMKVQLDKERRAMERIWKEREKQIERVVLNTSGMYGDIRGIAGASVQQIEALELDGGDAESSA
jgi:hypothetical protein